MKRNTGRNKEHKRKPYVKPEIIQVPLRPEEAVLAACKSHQGPGMVTTCTGPGGCQGNGS